MKLEITNSILSWIIKKRIQRIKLFLKDPIQTQYKQLDHLLSFAKNTETGKKYEFKTISNYKEFKTRIPIKTYEENEYNIKRIINGEQNILWPTNINWFAKSSGTTSSKSKFIPISKESLHQCHLNCGKDMLAIYCHNNPNSKIFNGRGLIMGGSKQLTNFSSNAYFGDLSAILIENLPIWVNFMRTPNKKTLLLDDWEEKLEKISKLTTNKNVTNITGVPSWTLVLLIL